MQEHNKEQLSKIEELRREELREKEDQFDAEQHMDTKPSLNDIERS